MAARDAGFQPDRHAGGSGPGTPARPRGWPAFLSFSLLFLLLPAVLAIHTGWLWSAQEEVAVVRREADRARAGLNRLLASLDPDSFLTRLGAALTRNILRRNLSDSDLISLWRRTTTRWGIALDVYRFDGQGRLAIPPDLPVRSRRLFQIIWDLMFHHRDLRPHEKAIHHTLGDRFRFTFLLNHPGELFEIRPRSSPGALYWERDPFSSSGGVMLAFWRKPDPLDLLQCWLHLGPPRAATILVGDGRGTWQPVGPAPADRPAIPFLERLQAAPGTVAEAGGRLWTAARLDTRVLCMGWPLPSSRIAPRRWGIAATTTVAFLLGLWLAFRWLVLGRDWYVSLRWKLVLLFLYGFGLSLGGIWFLSLKLLHDRRSVLESEVQRQAVGVIEQVEDGFLREQDRIEERFRRLQPTSKELQDFPDRFSLRLWKARVAGDLTGFGLFDLGGNPLTGLSFGAPDNSSARAVLEAFHRLAIERYLPDRLLAAGPRSPRPADLMFAGLVETPDSPFPYLMDHPGKLMVIQNPPFFDLVFWTFFPDPAHPAATLMARINYADALDRFFERGVTAAGEYEGGAFRVVVSRNDLSRWYPPRAVRTRALRDYARRVRMAREPLMERVSWRGRPFIAVGLPAKRATGHLLLALFPQEVVDRRLAEFSRSLKAGLLAGLLVILLTGLYVGDLLLVPLAELGRGIAAIQDRRTRFRVDIPQQDELGDLARAFNHTMEHLEELQAGSLVQAELFPAGPLVAPPYRVHGMSRPATDLGGDYFDYQWLGDRSLIVLIGDATGHGIPAALVMAMTKALVTRFQQSGSGKVEELVETLNQVLFETTRRRRRLITLALLHLDLTTHQATLVNCGHCYPMLLGAAGEVSLAAAQGPMLGAVRHPRFTPLLFALQPGERLLFFTDGLYESLTREGEDGLELLTRYVTSRPRLPFDLTCRDLLDHHPHVWSGQPLPDDFTLVLVEREPAQPPTTPARPATTAPPRIAS